MTGNGLSDDDLDGELGEALPAREVMTLITPSSGTSMLPGLTGADPTPAGGPAPTADSGPEAAQTTSADASHFTPPPSGAPYSPTATSSSTT
jgi:hypothetical protein